jgi:hypothetical protein
MLYIQVQSKRDPKVLAELIASTQNQAPVDPSLEIEAKILREHQALNEAERPSWRELETVNFQKLDDDNDWSDL